MPGAMALSCKHLRQKSSAKSNLRPGAVALLIRTLGWAFEPSISNNVTNGLHLSRCIVTIGLLHARVFKYLRISDPSFQAAPPLYSGGRL